MPEKDSLNTLFWGIIVISTIILIIMPFFNALAPGNFDPTYSMVFLVIFGVIDFIAVLTIAAKTFMHTRLACKDEALGLPSGSIRALIALSLIIIFAIMAIYMYTQLTPTANLLYVNANQTVVFPNGTTLTNPNAGTFVLMESTQAQRDFSGQTLTTVSTLVVALAGFYFGTKATGKEGEVEAEEFGLDLMPEGEVKYEKGKPVTIEIDPKPQGEKYRFKIDGDSQDSLRVGEVSNKLLYEPTKNLSKDTPTITFWLDNKPELKKQLSILAGRIEIVAKPSTKVKQGDKMSIDIKTIPDKEEIVEHIYGDLPSALKKEDYNKFTYTPTSDKRSSNSVLLTFDFKDAPKITTSLRVEVEEKK